MNGFIRRVSGNRVTRHPANHIAFDVETLPIELTTEHRSESFRLACAIAWRMDGGRPTREQRMQFGEPAHLHDWLATRCQPRQCTWLWAHNTVFDAQTGRLWFWLRDAGWKITQACMGGSAFIVRARLGDRSLVAVDTMNWFKMPLSKLGEKLGLPKMQFPEIGDEEPEWYTYCMRDCEIVQAAVVKVLALVREHDLGVMRPTLAGQALQAWRHRFAPRVSVATKKRGVNRDKLTVCCHDHQPAKLAERAAYYSVPIRVYRLGKVKGPITVLDVSSLYGSASLRTPMPVCLAGELPRPSVSRLVDVSAGAEVLAYVRCRWSGYEYPCRANKTLRYVKGRIWTWLAGPELRFALARGDVEACEAAWFYQPGRPFDSYVPYWFQCRVKARRDGDPVLDQVGKDFLNCLHGKLGQHGYEWQKDDTLDAEKWWGPWTWLNADTGEVRQCRTIVNRVEVQQDSGEPASSIVALSAWITSQARLDMWHLRQLAGADQVVYQAVDALHVLPAGVERLRAAGMIEEDVLGKLHLDQVVQLADYRGWNFWVGDGKVHLSGLPGRHQAKGDWWYEYEEFERSEGVLNRPQDGTIRVRKVKRNFKIRQPRGERLPHGWIELPVEDLCHDHDPRQVQ